MKQTLSYWEHIVFDNMCNNVSSRMNTPNNSKYNRYVGLEHLDTLEPKIMRWGSSRSIKSSVTLFKEGQILFGRRNWYLRRVAVADFAGVCSADIYVLEVHGDKIVHDFLPIFMHSEQFFNEVLKYSVGSMSTRVKWSHLAKIEFKIPKIAEQQKIVNIVSRIDDSVTKTQRLLEKIKTYKASKADELLTKGIGHKKFKKVKWLFGKEIEIPEEWSYGKILQLCETKQDIVGGPFGSNLVVNDYREQGIPIIRLQNIQRNQFVANNLKFIDKKKAKELQYHSYKPKDLVLAKLGDPIGKTCTIPQNFPSGIVVADVVRIRPSKKKCDFKFIEYVLNSIYCETQLNKERIGTTRPRVNLEQIRNLTLFIPPVAEQQKIASILSNIDKQIKQLEDHLSKLKTMRKSIINERLTPPKEDKIVQ